MANTMDAQSLSETSSPPDSNLNSSVIEETSHQKDTTTPAQAHSQPPPPPQSKMSNAATQTDSDSQLGSTTVNITIPNSQVSVFHLDAAADLTDQNLDPKFRSLANAHKSRPVSGVIVQPTDGSGDSVSVVSINLSNRVSVHSIATSPSPIPQFHEKSSTDSRGSIVFSDGVDIISLDVVSKVLEQNEKLKRTDSTNGSNLSTYTDNDISVLKSNAQQNSDAVLPETKILNDLSLQNPALEPKANSSSTLNVSTAVPIPSKTELFEDSPRLGTSLPVGVHDVSSQMSSNNNSVFHPPPSMSKFEDIGSPNIFAIDLPLTHPKKEDMSAATARADILQPNNFYFNSESDSRVPPHVQSTTTLTLPEHEVDLQSTPVLRHIDVPSSSPLNSTSSPVPSYRTIPVAYLPPLGFTDTITQTEVSLQIESMIASWPVIKGGYVVRRDFFPNSRRHSRSNNHQWGIPNLRKERSTSPSASMRSSRKMSFSNISNTAAEVSSRLFSRSFSNLLGAKKQPPKLLAGFRPQMQSPPHYQEFSDTASIASNATVSAANHASNVYSSSIEHLMDEENWTVYYAELRGRYMLFYRVNKDSSLAQNVNRKNSISNYSIHSMSPNNNFGFLKSSGQSIKEGKQFNKVLNKVFNKTGFAQSNPNRFSTVFEGGFGSRSKATPIPHSNMSSNQTVRSNDSDPSRRSTDSERSHYSLRSNATFSPHPTRTLVHYVCLTNILVEVITHGKLDQIIHPHHPLVELNDSPTYILLTSPNASQSISVIPENPNATMPSVPHDQIVIDPFFWEELQGTTHSIPVGFPANNTSSSVSLFEFPHTNSNSPRPSSSSNRSLFKGSMGHGIQFSHFETPERKADIKQWMSGIQSIIDAKDEVSGGAFKDDKSDGNFGLMKNANKSMTTLKSLNTEVDMRSIGSNSSHAMLDNSPIMKNAPLITKPAQPTSPPRAQHQQHRQHMSDNIGFSGALSPTRALDIKALKNTKLFSTKSWKKEDEGVSHLAISGPLEVRKADAAEVMQMLTNKDSSEMKFEKRDGFKDTDSDPPQAPPLQPFIQSTSRAMSEVTNTISALRDKAKKKEKKDEKSKERDEKDGTEKKRPGATKRGSVVGDIALSIQSSVSSNQPGNSQGKQFFGIFNRMPFQNAFTPSEVRDSAQQIGQPALVKGAMTKELFQPAGGLRIHRSPTMTSRTSTLRRRVGTNSSRPQSSTSQSTGEISLAASAPLPAPEIPLTLRKCIALVEEIGLDTEGLYRVSGSATTVDRLKRLFEADASKVVLYPPASASPLISSLSSPFISDFTPSLARRASRLSLTETVSSARSSEDIPPVPPVPSKHQAVMDAKTKQKQKRERGNEQQGNNNTDNARQNFFSFYNHKETTNGGKGSPGMSSTLGGSLYDNDVHVVTGVIKAYLRTGLPPNGEPLCTFNSYDSFMDATKIDDWRNRMIAMQDLVHALPPLHFATLKFVCDHLRRVSQHADMNKMNVKNLAIIFGTTLLKPHPSQDSVDLYMQNMQGQCAVAEMLIDQSEWLFGPIEFEEEGLPDGVSDHSGDEDMGVIEGFDGGVYGIDENGLIGPYASLSRDRISFRAASPAISLPSRKSLSVNPNPEEMILFQSRKNELLDRPLDSVTKPQDQTTETDALNNKRNSSEQYFPTMPGSDVEDNSSESWSNVGVVGIDPNPVAPTPTTLLGYSSVLENNKKEMVNRVVDRSPGSYSRVPGGGLTHSNSRRNKRKGVVEGTSVYLEESTRLQIMHDQDNLASPNPLTQPPNTPINNAFHSPNSQPPKSSSPHTPGSVSADNYFVISHKKQQQHHHHQHTQQMSSPDTPPPPPPKDKNYQRSRSNSKPRQKTVSADLPLMSSKDDREVKSLNTSPNVEITSSYHAIAPRLSLNFDDLLKKSFLDQ
ncbi:Rho GTPase-activating protein 21 [Nowakowskiella sp. JEL0407]|nr:Rho GTPase-activating protein 21 [Nowakowskiella sp. JEL0407]